MSLVGWVIAIPSVYLGVALMLYIADGYFNMSNDKDDELNFICWGWPLCLLFSPLIVGDYFRDKLKGLRKKKEEQQAKLEKIRIAQEKEIESILPELDSMIEEDSKTKRVA